MASAALPFLFRAVEIDGEPYWDGGYMGNPPLLPFLRTTQSEDVIIVQINPVARLATPRTSDQIVNRLNGEVRKALELPDVQKRLSAQGLEPSWQSVEQFKAYVRSEIAKWGPIVRASRTSK